MHNVTLNRLFVIVRLDRTLHSFMVSPIKLGNDCMVWTYDVVVYNASFYCVAWLFL
jgi:hypothetical protein